MYVHGVKKFLYVSGDGGEGEGNGKGREWGREWEWGGNGRFQGMVKKKVR